MTESSSLNETELSDLKRGLKSRFHRRLGFLLGAVIAFAALLFWLVPPVWQLKQKSIEVEQFSYGKGRKVLVGPGTERWVSLRHVSKYFTYALITAEDGRFYEHMGIDPVEVMHSIKINMETGRYKRGASTLTQQLVRMCFLSRDKNLIRKFREVLGALLVEMLLEKEEILAWYVNLVEFGPGVYGIKAASAHYFDTLPAYLTLVEGIHLSIVLPSPSVWSRSIRQKKLTPFGQSRFVWTLQVMRQSGYVSDQQFDYAMKFGDFGRPVYGHPEIVEPEELEEPEVVDVPVKETNIDERSESEPEADSETETEIDSKSESDTLQENDQSPAPAGTNQETPHATDPL